MKMVKGKGKKKVAPRKPKTTALVPIVEAVPEGKKLDSTDVQVNPQALLVQAIQKGLPLEAIERLLAMRKELKAEWAREQYFEALSGFQSECPVIEKNHKANIKSKKGESSSFSYAYAPIEDLVEPVRDLFVKWGLSWTSKPTQTREDVTANVYVHHKDGHEELTSFTVPIDSDAFMSDPQKAASALTFATRYAFKAAFGIQTKGEDNDAQSDTEPTKGYGKRVSSPQPTAGVKVKDNGKIVDAEVRALSPFEEFIAARKETEAVYTRMVTPIKAAGGEIMLYTPEELKGYIAQAAKAMEKLPCGTKGKFTVDDFERNKQHAPEVIAKLREMAIDWNVGYLNKLADHGIKEGETR